MALWLCLATVFLAYANGANDNFKGVATLLGSRTMDYRRALWWATATTFVGSLAALWISAGLIQAFSGKGLVPDLVTRDPQFLLAVGFGAALTVLLATVTGFPISTTHALTGALVGAGVVTAGSVHLARVGQAFFLPLAVSPLLSAALTAILYPAFRFVRVHLGVEREMCLCVEGGLPQPVVLQPGGTGLVRSSGIRLTVGEARLCREQYLGRIVGVDAQWILDRLHLLSAGAVSFARGLNDTPKITALLVAGRGLGLSPAAALGAVGVAMALGGLLSARRVARTMSERITAMNHGQGFTANLMTALLVLAASRFQLPVSTTHVSCGSLFGLGAVTGQAQWGMIRSIVLAWFVTLPIAAAFAAGLAWWFRA